MKFGLPDSTIENIQKVFETDSKIDEVIVFGSRAKGNYKEGSDIDLAIKGRNINLDEILSLSRKLDELNLPYKIDLINYATISDKDVIEHIDRVGIVFYERWKKHKLGEVVYINKNSINKEYSFEEIEYLDTGSITQGKIEGFQYFKLEDAPSRAKRLVNENDIIYSLVRPIQRHYGFIEKSNSNIVVSTGFAVITPIKEKVNPKYLFHLLSSDDIVNYLDTIAEGSTSAYPSLRPEDIAVLEISLPPVEEQNSIATVLNSLNDKIDLLHRQNKTLEQLAETLFRRRFVEKADKNWEVKSISEIIDVKDGTHDSPKQALEGNYLITSKHLKPDGVDFENAYKISESDFIEINKRSKVDENDILFSMIGTLGHIHVVKNKPNFAIKNIGLFKSSQKPWFLNFLYLLLKSKVGEKFIRESADGSTQEYITLGSLRNFKFSFPRESNIKEFDKQVCSIFQKVKSNTNQIKSLTQLRDIMLPKLMNGEMRIKN